MNRGRLILTKVGASTALSAVKNEHVALIPNVLLSREDEVIPATVTIAEEEEDGMVDNTLEWRRKESIVLSASLKLKLKNICEDNLLLMLTVSEYKVCVQNLDKNVDEEELNKMALLRELKRQSKRWNGWSLRATH